MYIRIRKVETRQCALFGFILGIIMWVCWLAILALLQYQLRDFPIAAQFFNQIITPVQVFIMLFGLAFGNLMALALLAAIWNVIGGIEIEADVEYDNPPEES